MFRSSRPFVLVAALTYGCFAAPATADAGWFRNWFMPRTTYYPTTTYYAPTTAYYAPTTAYYAPTTTYYAPTTAYYAPAASSCCTTGATTAYYAPAQTQTCNYVPSTTMQAQVVNTPVTGYRAVTRYNWLTGWPVTRYRPVTSYVQQVQYRPVTTYRLQCQTNVVAPANGYPTTTPTTQPGDTPAPSLAPGATPQDTFRQESNGATGQSTKALKPIPDANTNSNQQGDAADDGSSLILNDPANRTAQATTGWRIRTAVSHEDELKPRVIPAVESKPVHEQPVAKKSDNGGWRAAKKKN